MSVDLRGNAGCLLAGLVLRLGVLGKHAEGVTGQREYLHELLIGVNASRPARVRVVLSAEMGRPGGAEALQDTQRADQRVVVPSAGGDPCFEAVSCGEQPA